MVPSAFRARELPTEFDAETIVALLASDEGGAAKGDLLFCTGCGELSWLRDDEFCAAVVSLSMSSMAVIRVNRFVFVGGVLGRLTAAAAAGAEENRIPISRVAVLSLEPSNANGRKGGRRDGIGGLVAATVLNGVFDGTERAVPGIFESSSVGKSE